MTPEQAIAVIDANWPTENYTMLREALTLAKDALRAALVMPPQVDLPASAAKVLRDNVWALLDERDTGTGNTALLHVTGLTHEYATPASLVEPAPKKKREWRCRRCGESFPGPGLRTDHEIATHESRSARAPNLGLASAEEP